MYSESFVIPLTSSTDGHLVLWEPVSCEHFNKLDTIDEEQIINPLASKRVHQSSVKSCSTRLIDYRSETSLTFFIFTGGDDNALGLSIVKISTLKLPSENERLSITATIESFVIPNAHAGAITSTNILTCETLNHVDSHRGAPELCNTYQLVSVGADQRIKTWEVTIFPGQGIQSLKFSKTADHFTSVADPACMALFKDSSIDSSESIRGVVCGIGTEIWNLGNSQLP
jgi:hypothetical protein